MGEFMQKLQSMSRHISLGAISLILLATSNTTLFSQAQEQLEKPPLLPVEAFASLPDLSQMKLSPDGDKIGYIIEYQGRNAIVTNKLDGTNRQVIPSPPDADIRRFFWGNDDIIILEVAGTLNRQVFLGKSDESRLFTFNLKNQKFKWLGEQKRLLSNKRQASQQNYASQHERIVDFLPNDPKHILVEMDFELDAEASVYKVNIESGKRKEVRKDLRGIQNWFTDQNSEIIYGHGYNGSKTVIMFKQPNGDWIDLKKTDWYQKFDFEDFTSDPNIAYVSGRTEHGTNGIFTLDLRTGEPVSSVFSHKDVDIDTMVTHPITGKVAGVYYTTDFSRIEYFDKTLAKVQRSLAKALSGMIVTLVSMDAKGTKYLVRAENDRDPGSYYLYDRVNKQLNYIAPTRGAIFAEQMASAKMINVPVRDGSTITAILTMPVGKGVKDSPAIILPHGGPAARDNSHWDFWAQFYANRGYIVLQPNFRGSTGFGDAFFAKGRKQWGGLMQDDVTDATKWLIAEGYADPERICIVGASYGGYAALMGAIKEPNLYKCSVSVNGVTDLPRIKTNDKNSIGGRSWIKRMGLEGTDDKMVSPHDRADEINIPVLLMSSVDDARISYRMSQSTHDKLKKLGKDSTYVKIEDGTHHMVTKASRMTLLTETEKFLKKHIGN
jgi:dipeptidyl aminopeptidase/acylaminoacyl peptidase